jgi:superfamily II DNA or RNA helicase
MSARTDNVWASHYSTLRFDEGMNRDELDRLTTVIGELRLWVTRAEALSIRTKSTIRNAEGAAANLNSRVVSVQIDRGQHWNVLPLELTDTTALQLLAQRDELPRYTLDETNALRRLDTELPIALNQAKALYGVRRLFTTRKTRDAAEQAGNFLLSFEPWAKASGLPHLLDRADVTPARPGETGAPPVFARSTSLVRFLTDFGAPQVLAHTAALGLPGSIATIGNAIRNEAGLRQVSVDAGVELRRAETARAVAEMPIDRLKDATRERIRVAPLNDAGFKTVMEVLTHGSRLASLEGIGVTTAHRIRGAAQTIWQATYEDMPVRIDVQNPSKETRELVRSLVAWEASRRVKMSKSDLSRVLAFTQLAGVLGSNTAQVVVGTHAAERSPIIEAIDSLAELARAISTPTLASSPVQPWDDFLGRPADFFAMLNELGFLTESEEAVNGGLPDEIVAAVRAFEMDTRHLHVSLRGYQAFGAKFALVQKKVIIGDEMGLGKTVEALAAIAHLHAKGSRHSLVISPAAVVTNWVREVRAKSDLRAHRLHGPGRDGEFRSWLRNGGVAVSTYESLGWLEPHLASVDELACTVLDEAHYIKNPNSLRAIRSARLITRSERAILLTGTPLENRVDEFGNLVDYVRPDLAVDATDLRPRLFRQQVAPAYLRRNQEDVLTELPELVEVAEWVAMSDEDTSAYRDAVYSGNFQAMRQAAMLQGPNSEKVQRLKFIVEEAEENGRKVIIFSNYLSVLKVVIDALSGRVHGPLTGSVPAEKRQLLVDEFSAAEAGAVLVAQIIAGGVGLNIQAASVVVICEPQLKPTTEWQAIARARRMGQLNTVQVHRLLSDEGVDLRVTQILAQKKQIFADYAAISETAESAPEAFDISEAELVKQVVDDERRRLFGGLQAEADENTAAT